MRLSVAFLFLGLALSSEDQDQFNYDATIGNNYGPVDWQKVACNNYSTCPGWPDDWEKLNPFIPYSEANNTCMDCGEGKVTEACKQHNQSPIHLFRNVTAKNICHDRHKMHAQRGNCAFQDMRFTIERHVLRAQHPMFANGSISCLKPSNIDFSMGFPDPWRLVHTDIKVPSEHMQDGERYDAEVVLSHVYSKNKMDKYIGNVAIFLKGGNESHFYDFLDLYIRRWKKERKFVRQRCITRRHLGSHNSRLEDATYGQANISSDFGSQQTRRTTLFRRTFHSYDWLRKLETEYYFRYEGSQTVPPCFDAHVHWRVMKDPIVVAPAQIRQLENLVSNRIDPISCVKDTAGKSIGRDNIVDTSRPIQSVTTGHKVVFCECIDWPSRKESDKEWCKLSMEARGVLPHWKTKLNETMV